MDWDGIVAALRKRGLSYDDIANLTIAQVQAEFADGESAFYPTKETAGAIRQRELFDAVCFVHGMAPAELAGMDGQRIVMFVREFEENPKVLMDCSVMKAAAECYASR